MNVKTLLKETLDTLSIDTLDAQLLLAYVLEKNRAWLIAHDDYELHPAELQRYQELVARRAEGLPLAYLTGTQEFWGMPFTVTPATLIPRPETERLIEQALTIQPQPKQILDMGTGSGIIAITLAKEWPDSVFVATDVSRAALSIAQENANKLGANNITFKRSRWYDDLDASSSFDLIVSNPPYIAPSDPHLEKLRFEPQQALIADDAGLCDIEQIIDGASAFLNTEGWLMLEHGYDQQEAVQALLQKYQFTAIETLKDLAGWPRISVGQKRI